METIKTAENASDYFPSEIPPIFKTAIPVKADKSADGVALFRVTATAIILISLVVLRFFFPEIYAVVDSWIIDKSNMLQLLT